MAIANEEEAINELEKRIGYVFHDRSLPHTAMTHRSYVKENNERYIKCNERLEFLGDSVLNMLAAQYLCTAYPEMPEGELTKLRAMVVCEPALHAVALRLRIGELLRLGNGEDSNGGRERPSILADCIEAVIAAVYLDGGLECARELIGSFLPKLVKTAVGSNTLRDNKTVLQELVQKNRGQTLCYRLVGEEGPDHDKRFVSEVCINDKPVAQGEGKSKKEAEQQAARRALELLEQ